MMCSLPFPAPPRPQKKLGQHFLRDAGICARITALLDVSPEDSILEIGPGSGALTSLLEKLPHKRLILLERDPYWAKARQRHAQSGTQTVSMNALRFAWNRLSPDWHWKIIGNLPYNVASPLIWDIVSQTPCLQRAVFMVQKEVGERICAHPGGRKYGALSVWVQSHATPTFEFAVPPGAFNPKPRINSAVVSFLPVPSHVRKFLPRALSNLLAICFQQRRKQLGGILLRAGLPDHERALEQLGITASSRPETLEIQDFHRLANFFAAHLDKRW